MKSSKYGLQSVVTLVLSAILVLSCSEDDPQSGTIFPVPPSSGITYYVSSNGNDSNDGMSQNTAWESSSKVNDFGQFAPGDQILFRRGDIFNRIVLRTAGNGTEEDPIIIGAYGDENDPRPIIQGDRSPMSFGIHLNSMSGWTIQDLTVEGANGDQIYIEPTVDRCDNIKILRCQINGDGGRHGIRFETDIRSGNIFGSRNVEIAYNYIEKAGQGFDNTSDGINAPNIQEAAFIHHNILINNKSEGVDIGAGKNHIVEYNLIDGANDRDSGGIKTHVQSGQQVHDTENIDLRYNIIYNCIQHAIQIQDGRLIRVYNNSIYHNHENGRNTLLIGTANDNQYDDQTWIMGNQIINNIFYGNTKNISVTVLRFAGGRTGSPAAFWEDPARYKIENNIFYGGSAPNGLVIRVQTGQFKSENEFTDYSNVTTTRSLSFEEFLQIHQNNFNLDPRYSDPENQDFTLQPGSPAIDTGAVVGLTNDFNDQPVDNTPNIGAFEN